jgi:hypothetical protein
VVAGRQDASPPTATSSPTRGAATATRLPNARVTLDGKKESLRQLVPAVLAWVPAGCTCLAALKELARQAAQAKVRLYLVGPAGATMQLPHLATEVGRHSSQVVVDDPTNAVTMTYSPIGLTAILARRDGTVGGVIRGLQMTDAKVADAKVATALPTLASPSPVAGRGTPPASPSQPAPRAT